MNSKTLKFVALIFASCIGLTVTSKAIPTYTLTMTELSSTSLTYSWNGLLDAGTHTITTATPDHWIFTVFDDVVTQLGGTQNINVNWKEPEYATSGLVNYVNLYQYGSAVNGTTITVISDHMSDTAGTGYPLIANGGSYTFNPVSGANTASYTDNGDSAGVPDGGVTAILLGLGMVSLGALRGKLNFRISNS
jgi:hypothetical protein